MLWLLLRLILASVLNQVLELGAVLCFTLLLMDGLMQRSFTTLHVIDKDPSPLFPPPTFSTQGMIIKNMSFKVGQTLTIVGVSKPDATK